MECTMISFKWKTGQIQTTIESIIDYSVSPAELKKLLNMATENRDEVKAQLSEYLNTQLAVWKKDKYSTFAKKMTDRLQKLLAVIEERKQTAQERALAKILKSCPRETLQGVIEDAGKHCVMNGYMLVRCSSPLSGFDPAVETFDTAKAIGDVSQYSAPLPLPSLKDLRADMKLARNSAAHNAAVPHYHVDRRGKVVKVYYDFGYGLPMVDAEYLLYMLEALPDCKALSMPGKQSRPVYFVSGDSDGILLPVRKDREYEEPPVEEAAAIPAAAETTEAAQTVETAQPVTEAEKPEEDAREAAQARVEAVAAAVRTSAADDEDLARTCRMLRRGFITEDEAKRLLLFPVSVTCPPLLALPAPAEVPDAVTVSVVDPVAVVAAACAACSSVTVPEACRDIDGSREAEERGSSRTEAEAPPGNSSSDRSAACCSVSRGSGPGYISAAICAFSDRPAACCACSICYYDTS